MCLLNFYTIASPCSRTIESRSILQFCDHIMSETTRNDASVNTPRQDGRKVVPKNDFLVLNFVGIYICEYFSEYFKSALSLEAEIFNADWFSYFSFLITSSANIKTLKFSTSGYLYFDTLYHNINSMASAMHIKNIIL